MVWIRLIFTARDCCWRVAAWVSHHPANSSTKAMTSLTIPSTNFFPLLGRSQVRMADGAGLRDLVEFIHEINRARVLHVGFAVHVGVFGAIPSGSGRFDAV